MKHRIRRLVLGLLAAVALLANALLLLRGPSKKEADDKAKRTQKAFLASTAIASILAIAALLLKRHREDNAHHEALGHCPVCDVRLVGQGGYCSACGSRM
jgi:peptidoglycan biosynthesis protein MviN/MurJ (putative lipid II flippase)